jgi:hypothetical protein
MSELFETLNSLADIESLIEGCVRESETLEYKGAAAQFDEKDKGEIAKDVSAMANSGGGLIVYGITTDRSDKTKPAALAPIYLKNIETFDRVVNSQIKPPIKNLRKKVIPRDQPRVMLIDVPESEDPPHQSLHDKKYYRRSGVESLPMEHDLVALLFGRKTGPLLDVEFQSLKSPQQFVGPLFYEEGLLRVFVRNSGRRIGRYVETILLFPPQEQVRITTKSGDVANIDSLHLGKQARQFAQNVSVFHPRLRKSILELGIEVSKAYRDNNPDDALVSWTIFADEMNPRGGSVSLRDLGWG